MAAKSAHCIPQGTYALDLSGVETRKRKDQEEHIALRYAFKPASITPTTPGVYQIYNPVGQQVVFNVPNGHQVFDVRQEQAKRLECLMILNEDTNTFEVHPFGTTLHLTLNRSASSTYAASNGSTSSSSSYPLSGLPRSAAKSVLDSHIEVDGTTETVPVPSSAAGGTKAGASKGVGKGGRKPTQRKPMDSAPIPVIGKTRSTSNTKPTAKGASKATKTAPPRNTRGAQQPEPKGKYKSAEYIVESDEDALEDGVDLPPPVTKSRGKTKGKGKQKVQAAEVVQEDDDGMDEFASLLGQSLAEGGDYPDAELDAEGEDDLEEVAFQSQTQLPSHQRPGQTQGYTEYAYADDDSDEESESEEEDYGLGGARLVAHQSGKTDDGSEWI